LYTAIQLLATSVSIKFLFLFYMYNVDFGISKMAPAEVGFYPF